MAIQRKPPKIQNDYKISIRQDLDMLYENFDPNWMKYVAVTGSGV